MEAPAVGEGDRVDDEVVVQMCLVQVRGHHHLEPRAPQLLRERHPDFVRGLGVRLAGRERLVAVERDDAALLAVLPLGGVHLGERRLGQAVDAGDVALLLGLAGVRGVEDRGANALAFPLVGRALGLGWVLRVAQHAGEPPLHLPYRSDGQFSPSFPAP